MNDKKDALMVAHMKCPNAVLSHNAALHFHTLIDREPMRPTLTIYSGYNANSLKNMDTRFSL